MYGPVYGVGWARVPIQYGTGFERRLGTPEADRVENRRRTDGPRLLSRIGQAFLPSVFR